MDDAGKVLGLVNDIKHTGSLDKLGLQIVNTFGDLLRPNPVELVRLTPIEIDGQTILRIDVNADRRNHYQSPSTKKDDTGKNILRLHVRIHASVKGLDPVEAIAWSQRRSEGPST